MWNSLKGEKMKTHIPFTCVLKENLGSLQRKRSYIFILLFWSNTFPSDSGYKSERLGGFCPIMPSFQKKWGKHLFINLKKSNTSPALGHVAHCTQSAFIWLGREKGQEQRKKWRLNMLASVPYGLKLLHFIAVSSFVSPFPSLHPTLEVKYPASRGILINFTTSLIS